MPKQVYTIGQGKSTLTRLRRSGAKAAPPMIANLCVLSPRVLETGYWATQYRIDDVNFFEKPASAICMMNIVGTP